MILPLFLIVPILIYAQDSWIQKSDFGGTNRYNTVSFSIGDTGYIGTGYDGSTKSDFWQYDPVNDSWSQMANFIGTARYAATGFSVNEKGYIGTGLNINGTTSYRNFYEYNPATNSWLQKADFGGSARRGCTGFTIGPKGYIGLGWDGSYKKDFWEYDPIMDQWTQISDFGGSARFACAAFSIAGKAYVGNGTSGPFYNDLWEYNPGTDAWIQKADFPGAARSHGPGFSIGNKGYFGTGSTNGTYYTDFWAYDPNIDAWTQKKDFPDAGRYAPAVFTIGNKAYLGTGKNGSVFYTDFWEYDPCGGFEIQVYATDATCYDVCNGTATVSTTGDTLSYSFNWSNGNNNQNILNLCIGTYGVTVFEPSGCLKSDSVAVNAPPLFVIDSVPSVPATCQSCNDGSATVYSSGGTPPYTYQWSDNETNPTNNGLASDTFFVTVYDANGCTVTGAVYISTAGGSDEFSGTGIKLKIYPNPSNGLIFVLPVTPGNYPRLELHIINIAGKEVVTRYILPGEIPPVISTRDLSGGMYTCILKSDRAVLARRTIVITGKN